MNTTETTASRKFTYSTQLWIHLAMPHGQQAGAVHKCSNKNTNTTETQIMIVKITRTSQIRPQKLPAVSGIPNSKTTTQFDNVGDSFLATKTHDFDSGLMQHHHWQEHVSNCQGFADLVQIQALPANPAQDCQEITPEELPGDAPSDSQGMCPDQAKCLGAVEEKCGTSSFAPSRISAYYARPRHLEEAEKQTACQGYCG